MKRIVTVLAASTALAAPALAQDLSVVGSWSSLPLHNQYEAPFWNETLPAASGGKINVSLTTHNQMNLGVGDVFRLLGDGVYDVAMTVADYAVADAPELEMANIGDIWDDTIGRLNGGACPQSATLNASGMLRLLPQRDNTDGFFIAIIQARLR